MTRKRASATDPMHAKKLLRQLKVDVEQVIDNAEDDFARGFNAEAADHQADLELSDVLTWLRRHERDMLLGIEPPPLQALIAMLEAGEHRR